MVWKASDAMRVVIAMQNIVRAFRAAEEKLSRAKRQNTTVSVYHKHIASILHDVINSSLRNTARLHFLDPRYTLSVSRDKVAVKFAYHSYKVKSVSLFQYNKDRDHFVMSVPRTTVSTPYFDVTFIKGVIDLPYTKGKGVSESHAWDLLAPLRRATLGDDDMYVVPLPSTHALRGEWTRATDKIIRDISTRHQIQKEKKAVTSSRVNNRRI